MVVPKLSLIALLHNVVSSRPGPGWSGAWIWALVLASVAIPCGAAAQDYALTSRSGLTLELTRDRLLQMHDTTVALQENLELDPAVLYWYSFGPDAPPDSAGPTLPWNAVEVVTDSTVAVTYPGNLREADRAYNNYAVLRMQAVRGDPDVSCDALFQLEVQAVGLFVDGWIASRTLFGGPAYDPLDELAFAREAGHLAGLIASHENFQLGGCLDVWRDANREAVTGYRTWRREVFLGGNSP